MNRFIILILIPFFLACANPISAAAAAEDNLKNINKNLISVAKARTFEDLTYTFVISPGHVGTHSLFEWFQNVPGLRTVHEDEPGIGYAFSDVRLPWQRALDFNAPDCDDESLGKINDYILDVKLPHIVNTTNFYNATSYFETGHQITLGMIEPLINILGTSRIKVIRLRRDRIMTAKSYYFTFQEDVKGPCAFNVSHLHIAACPWSLPCSTFSPITPQKWVQLNAFQQYLWYVDNVEFLWRRIVGRNPELQTLQVSIEQGVEAAEKISKFIGFPYKANRVQIRYFQHVGKEVAMDEEDLKRWQAWDTDYQTLVFGRKQFNHTTRIPNGASKDNRPTSKDSSNNSNIKASGTGKGGNHHRNHVKSS